MKSMSVVVCALALAGCQTGEKKGGQVSKLESKQDRVSYAIGLNVGANMLRDSVRFTIEPLMQGLKDAALDTAQRMMKPAEVEQTLMAYQEELKSKAMEARMKQGEASKKKSEDFMEQNKTRPTYLIAVSQLCEEGLRVSTAFSRHGHDRGCESRVL